MAKSSSDMSCPEGPPPAARINMIGREAQPAWPSFRTLADTGAVESAAPARAAFRASVRRFGPPKSPGRLSSVLFSVLGFALAVLAGRIHRDQLAAAQVHHMGRQAAAPGDPVAHLLRIDRHQELGTVPTHHRATGAIGPPGGMKSEPRPGGDAQMVARDDTEHHGAGGEAGAVDHDVLARAAERSQILQIRSDLASRIAGNSHGR